MISSSLSGRPKLRVHFPQGTTPRKGIEPPIISGNWGELLLLSLTLVLARSGLAGRMPVATGLSSGSDSDVKMHTVFLFVPLHEMLMQSCGVATHADAMPHTLHAATWP